VEASNRGSQPPLADVLSRQQPGTPQFVRSRHALVRFRGRCSDPGFSGSRAPLASRMHAVPERRPHGSSDLILRRWQRPPVGEPGAFPDHGVPDKVRHKRDPPMLPGLIRAAGLWHGRWYCSARRADPGRVAPLAPGMAARTRRRLHRRLPKPNQGAALRAEGAPGGPRRPTDEKAERRRAKQ
jgi:hypothetical protein